MVRLLAKVLLPCAIGMMASGCGGATGGLYGYATKMEVRDHRIAEVVSASRAKDGAILICATGWPAKRGRDKRPVAFSITLPNNLTDVAVRKPVRTLARYARRR